MWPKLNHTHPHTHTPVTIKCIHTKFHIELFGTFTRSNQRQTSEKKKIKVRNRRILRVGVIFTRIECEVDQNEWSGNEKDQVTQSSSVFQF